MNAKFLNPFDAALLTQQGEIMHRTTIRIPKREYAFIQGVHGSEGTLQTTLNLLLNALINELKRTNNTDFNPGAYELAVTDACERICAGNNPAQRSGSAVAQPQSQRPSPQANDDGGVANLAPKAPTSRLQPSSRRGRSRDKA